MDLKKWLEEMTVFELEWLMGLKKLLEKMMVFELELLMDAKMYSVMKLSLGYPLDTKMHWEMMLQSERNLQSEMKMVF